MRPQTRRLCRKRARAPEPARSGCADDAGPRATVVALVRDIGADLVDAGPLKLARLTEPLGLLVTNVAYIKGFGARIGSVLIRDHAA